MCNSESLESASDNKTITQLRIIIGKRVRPTTLKSDSRDEQRQRKRMRGNVKQEEIGEDIADSDQEQHDGLGYAISELSLRDDVDSDTRRILQVADYTLNVDNNNSSSAANDLRTQIGARLLSC